MGLIFSIDNQSVKQAAAYVDKRNSSLGWCEGEPGGLTGGEVRANRTAADSWREAAAVVGVVESRCAEDEWYALSYGQCHKNLASGIAGVRTDRAGVARNAGDPCRWSPPNKDGGSWGRQVVSTRWRPKVHLSLRIEDEAGHRWCPRSRVEGQTGIRARRCSTCPGLVYTVKQPCRRCFAPVTYPSTCSLTCPQTAP